MKPRASVLDFLPELYRSILPSGLDQPLEDESKATCARCVMCKEGAGEGDVPPGFFSPSTRCCTYHPALPNYSVGGLLSDASPEGEAGRQHMLRKIQGRIGVTPLGVGPSRKVGLLYRNGTRGFGIAGSLVCPYLDAPAGRCTVWRYRESVCTTWFCKHDAGRDGRAFWKQLGGYLVGTELILSAHALRELGWDVGHILPELPPEGDLDARMLDEAPPSDADYRATWGDWAGREVEHFVRCHEVVRRVDRERLAALGGLRHALELERLDKRYRAMRSPEIPDPLLKNPALRVRKNVDGTYVLVSYAVLDPARLRKPVYDLLDEFDGHRSTSEVRAGVLEKQGQWLSDSLVRRLFQHRILVDPARPAD